MSDLSTRRGSNRPTVRRMQRTLPVLYPPAHSEVQRLCKLRILDYPDESGCVDHPSQVLKQFTSGGSSSGGGSQTQLISLAMAEASKLFDKSGGAASGNKQDAVNGAAMTVMKLLVQSKFSGGTTGGSNSGGLGQLMGLVSGTLMSCCAVSDLQLIQASKFM